MLFSRVKKLLIFLLVCCCAVGLAYGEGKSESEKLHSEFVARMFHDVGYEILNNRQVTAQDFDKAMGFIIAASELDQRSTYINETILVASVLASDDKYDKWISRAFDGYCGSDADILVAIKGAAYFLKGHKSLPKRQKALLGLLNKLADRLW